MQTIGLDHRCSAPSTPRRGARASGRVRTGAVLTTAAALLFALMPLACPGADESASADATPRRPRIGLVLSGGGARGAAHIGVLRVLEELRIPIDCIAGTSMGAIVGASYASGTSVDEMEEVLREVSSSDLYHETLPRRDQQIHRKKDDGELFVGPELGLRNGALKLPNGVVSGIRLEGVLRSLARVEGFQRFDELPIPFRAIATDIATGDMVVMDQGELPAVMRASMSVPGAIAPAQMDGRVLLDGGLVRNLPVDVVRELCADVVIAVNLGTPLLRQEDISSFLGVTQQMITILSKQNVRASLASLGGDDVLVSPELGSYSATDFDHMRETVPIGEAAARRVAGRLSHLALSPEAYAAYRQRRVERDAVRAVVVDDIRFDGLERANEKVLAASMETKPGRPVDFKTVDNDIRRLYGRGDFEHIDYRIVDDDRRRVLAIDLQEKSWGPDYLRFGLTLVADFPGDSYFNLAARYRRRWLNDLGAEVRLDAQAGYVSRIAGEFYQPLDVHGRFFVAPYAEFERRPLDIYAGRQRIARFTFNTYDVGADLGMAIGKYAELRAGAVNRYIKARLDTGLPPFFTDDNVHQVGPRLRFVYDQLDSLDFPRDGTAATVSAYSAKDEEGRRYVKLDLSAQAATSIGPHTLQGVFELHGSPNGRLPDVDLVKFGGFQQLSGYRTNQLLGTRLAYGSLAYLYRLHSRPLFGATYLGASIEAGRMRHIDLTGAPRGLLLAGSVFVGLDTPVGPLYIAYGHTRDGNNSAYIFLGRP